MTRHDEIDNEIRNQAVKFYPKCAALFELPNMVYCQIIKDNQTRKTPYKVSFARIQKVIACMPEFD